MTETDTAPPPIPDLTAIPPLCEAEFAEMVDEMIAGEAPRVFAVVQEYGERVDARIAAWGLAFDDRAKIVDLDGAFMSLRNPERATQLFGRGDQIHARLVWLTLSATPTD